MNSVTKAVIPAPRPATTTVVFLDGLVIPAGGRWNAGERAGFPPDVAADLIERGVAAPALAPAAKAPAGPPAAVMVKEAPRKK